MAFSDKQIATSRANGAKSIGPVSPAGKRNSSRNSTRHGILASVVLIDGESRQRFAALINSFNAEFLPQTPTEIALVQKMAVSHWRLLRTWALESASVTHEMKLQSESMTGEDTATRAMLAFRSLGDSHRDLDLTSRYEHRFDRQHYRALDALDKLRDRRDARAKRTRQVEESRGLVKCDEPAQNTIEPAK